MGTRVMTRIAVAQSVGFTVIFFTFFATLLLTLRDRNVWANPSLYQQFFSHFYLHNAPLRLIKKSSMNSGHERIHCDPHMQNIQKPFSHFIKARKQIGVNGHKVCFTAHPLMTKIHGTFSSDVKYVRSVILTKIRQYSTKKSNHEEKSLIKNCYNHNKIDDEIIKLKKKSQKV